MVSKWPLEGSNSYCFPPKSAIQTYGRFGMIQSNQWKVSLKHQQQFGTAVLSLTHKGLKWVTHSKPLPPHFHQYSSCIKRKLVTKKKAHLKAVSDSTHPVFILDLVMGVFSTCYIVTYVAVFKKWNFFPTSFLTDSWFGHHSVAKMGKKKYFMHIFSLSVGLLTAPILTSIELPVTTYFNADWINVYTAAEWLQL